MTRSVSVAVAEAFRRTALPLACYYAVTLGIPIANGAAQAGAAFVGHSLVVLLLPPVLILIVCTAGRIAAALRGTSRR